METGAQSSALTIGNAVGSHRERPAPLSLQRHFSHLWFHSVPADASREVAIVPDGLVDLLWVDGELVVAGPDRVANIESLPPGKTVIGFRFQPGAIAAWLRLPATELLGARAPLETFWGAEARRLADWAAEAGSVEAIADRLAAELSKRASRDERQDDATASQIFRLIGSDNASYTHLMRRLTTQLGSSERTIRRSCHEMFGYGPKTLDRILRFQRFLSLMRSSAAVQLAQLAAEAGYADQSHLTRETRELAGFAPGAIAAQLAA